MAVQQSVQGQSFAAFLAQMPLPQELAAWRLVVNFVRLL